MSAAHLSGAASAKTETPTMAKPTAVITYANTPCILIASGASTFETACPPG